MNVTREEKGGAGGRYLESNAQEIQDPHSQAPALIKDARDLALVRCQGGRDGLLRLAVDELAKVEGPLSLSVSRLHRGGRGEGCLTL